MHYHCEIVMPPTSDIATDLNLIMDPFYKGNEGAAHAFWGFWSIGGRWAGTKWIARLDKTKLEQFQQWLLDESITVSSVQWGKPDVSPASQVGHVDAKWNQMFPHASGEQKPCPFFRHSNTRHDQSIGSAIDGDICALCETRSLSCSRIIFAAPGYNIETKSLDGPTEATFMLSRTIWNGCNHMPVTWDGTIRDALNQFAKCLRHSSESYREQVTPRDDWLAVTVDYHS